MTSLKKAAATKKRAEKAAKDAQEAFEVTVVDALGAGLKPAEVATATGFSYETIRRIARHHKVERLREPTVTSRRKAQADDQPSA